MAEMFRRAGQEGWSGRRLKNWLDEQGFTNRSGRPITISQIFIILTTTFYYGEFEYPEGSGKWFKGAHKPLISKELYELVQQTRGAYKGKWGSKQFALRGLIKCGQCGAEFTAQEKFKKLKNGEFNRHVYYNCTRRVDPNCTEKYINEKDLCKLLQEFIEKSHDKINLSDKLLSKTDSHYQVTTTLLEHYNLKQPLDIPLVEYSRYILVRGNEAERAMFAAGIKTMLQLRNGELELAGTKSHQ